MQDQLKEFIGNANHIPSIPSQMTHLLQTISSPKASTAEIGKLIIPDATLSARILRLANSAFYYRMSPVTRINDALTRLGFKTTRSMVVTVWTQSMKAFTNNKAEAEMVSHMLNHGTACSVIAKALMDRINRPMAEDVFLAALLHDMGRLAITSQLGKQYLDDVLVFAEKSNRDTSSVEEQVLGFNHCMLGAHLMQSWHLPTLFKDIAQDHHNLSIEPGNNPALASTMLADTWATELGYNVAMNAYRQKRDELVDFFKISDISQFKEDCKNKITAMIEILNS